MLYPARFIPADEGGYVVTFRDIPEAITQGETQAEAMAMAEDVLVSALDFYFEGHRTVPKPSPAQEGERLIALPHDVSAKVLQFNSQIEASL